MSSILHRAGLLSKKNPAKRAPLLAGYDIGSLGGPPPMSCRHAVCTKFRKVEQFMGLGPVPTLADNGGTSHSRSLSLARKNLFAGP